MFAFGNRQAKGRKQRKASEGRRGEQAARAAYKTQLRIEPLEDRRLLSVFAVTNLLDGSVAQAGDLPGSLRQAIFDANANPGADTITFDSSLSGGTILLTSGELAITDSVTIQGPGAADLTIDGGGHAGGLSRIFDVNDNTSANINVEIDGLTLTGGNASGAFNTSTFGGAILSYENLTVRDSTITGNTAGGCGGGIYSGTSGTTLIDNSTISGNNISEAGGGGGIAVWMESAGNLTIQNSTISGNTAIGCGGGVYLIGDNAGSVITIKNSAISGNTSNAGGGGIFSGSSGTTLIENSAISGNTATGWGGGILAPTQGTRTTTIQDSTIFGNSAGANGGGIAAIATNGGATTIQNSTVTGNLSDSDSDGAGAGGGIFAYSNSGTVSVQSTIISANGDNSGTAPDISGTVNIDHSLVGDNTGSGLTEVPVGTTDPSGNGNIIGDPNGQGTIDAGLNLLADNGGPTLTCALAATSPAVDMGSNPANLTYDQRGVGFDRVIGSAPDMGAYEFKPAVSLSLVVDTLADENDGDYSPGHLSLREAVALANANPMPDTISFDPSLDGGTIHLTLGELPITDSVTIQGPGAGNLTIDAGNHSRIFDVNDYDYTTNIDVTIDGLTLTGGNATGAQWPDNSGGAILSFDNLTLSNCTVEGNTAADFGGGILTEAFAGGTSTINASTISGNTAGVSGGGIWSQSYATTVIENSVISGNTSGGDGGGLYTRASNYGTATIHGSTISGNTAANRGGGIWASTYNGATTIEYSTVSANTSHGAGGGIWTEADGPSAMTIQGSTISGNAADGDGGGIWAYTGGASTTIQNSTISGNTAGGRAGGLYSNNYGTATLQNSTVTGNTSNDAGGGVYSHNHYYYGSYNSTFPLIIRSTIIAGNSDTSGTATDVTGQLAISTSLVGDNTGSGLPEAPVGGAAPGGTSNIVGDPHGQGVIDPKLGPLADNGGPTWTCALLAGSPAIDAGANPTGLSYDQRGVGFSRTLGMQTDMGAFESPDTTPPVATLDPKSVVVTASAATFTVTYADPDGNVLLSSIDDSDILVACPDGSHQYASLVSVTPDADGSPLVATYQVNASGGAWSMANTGVFSATMQSGQVSDTHNNFVVGGSLGTFEVEAWIPYIPTTDQTTVSVKTANHDTTATVSFIWSARYRVSDWGQPTWNGTSCQVNLEVEEWTGVAPGGVTTVSHSYDLGTLAPNNYNFAVVCDGHSVGAASFYASSVTIDRVVIAEATPRNGILNSNDPLVITWAINGADTVAEKLLQVDGKTITSLYGPYGPNADGSYYVAGAIGTLSAGVHTYVIHATDSQGYTSSYSGQFVVMPSTTTITSVTIAENNGPKNNGILDSSDPLVITWAVTGADTVASKSLLVDGTAVSVIYGPYGPHADGSYYFAGAFGPVAAGTHTFSITSTDGKGVVGSYSGTFNVLPVAGNVTIASVVVAENGTPKNGVLETSDPLVITWAVKGADTVASRSLLIDGKAVSSIYGPYGPQADGSYYFAGTFGPLTAGSHTYTIQSTDSKGHSASATGGFGVTPVGVTTSNVVVAEAQAPKNGVIGTEESIVITWALTGPTAATTAASKTVLTVDGKVISTVYGPYGPVNGGTYQWAAVFGPVGAGTHTYQINTNAGAGLTSLYTGTFKVSSAAYLTVDASQPPQGSAAPLSDSQLAPIVTEAERRWAAADGAAAIAGLAGVKVEVADLPAGTLGETDGKTILIDQDAAGYGWFVDPTPGDDSEFVATPGGPTLVAAKGSAAASHVDLLTTVMHELGHELGLEHVAADDLMNAVLPLGVRRNISGLDVIGSGSSEYNSVDQLFATIGA